MASYIGKLKPYLLLLVILLLAYLPLSTFHFAMKNDAFSDNFPNKFFLTEAFRSGFLPLWNPYLNFGFPVYADPGFAFWNPITWFFGALLRYNAYTLTIEVLLYIYIAGITMFRLGRYFRFSNTTAITIAAMYMCSGFFTGELQHINFLTAAAFLPFLLQKFLTLTKNPTYRNCCFTAIGYYMVFAGGHPAIPFATVYFLLTLSLSIFIFNSTARKNWKSLLWYHFAAMVIFIILYFPAIYSYFSILPEYGRGTPAEQLSKGASQTGFSFSSYLSFLYPFATTKTATFMTDDLAMRNSYFSVAGFVLALTQLKNKSYLVRSFVIAGLVMLILSSGGFLKTVIYSHLPLLNYIRTNGEFRIFIILSLCILSGYAITSLEINTQKTYVLFRKILRTILAATILLLISLAVYHFTDLSDFPKNYSNLQATGLKAFIDRLSFVDVLLLSLIIYLGVVVVLLLAKINTRKIACIIIANLILNSIIYLPFSGVGVVTLAEVQQVYNKSPLGITVPALINIKSIDTLPTKLTGLVGSWAFYNKNIGITQLQDYPSYFKTTDEYFNSTFPTVINNHPYVFLKSDINGVDSLHHPNSGITVISFPPQKITLHINISENDSVILLQNYYRFWHAKVDGQETKVNRSFITFMSVPLHEGVHTVEFFYEDKWLLIFTSLSLLAFIFLLMFISVIREKS